MAIDKSLISGNTDMLILKLLEKQDMYGYQMIEELAKQSDHTFELKAGTLYPLLHLLEQKQYLVSYDGETVAGKTRKYYRITDEGKRFLVVRLSEWESYSAAVNKVLSGGVLLAGIEFSRRIYQGCSKIHSLEQSKGCGNKRAF